VAVENMSVQVSDWRVDDPSSTENRRLQKTCREHAGVTWRSSSFQTQEAAVTETARSPTVGKRVQWRIGIASHDHDFMRSQTKIT